MSGAEFDKHYMAMMVEDHDKDVAMFESEAKSGKDPDVKAWASKTVPVHQEHQQQARQMSAAVTGSGRQTGAGGSKSGSGTGAASPATAPPTGSPPSGSR